MNIFGKIFGSESVVQGAVDGIDKVWYTDEEKADAFRKLLKLYEPFKLAQRLLALIFSIPFVILATWGISTNNTEMVNNAINVFGTPVALIIGFYFAGGALEGVAKAKGIQNAS